MKGKRGRKPGAKLTGKELANLIPYKPGQSGNPGGNPRSLILSAAYRAELSAVNPDDPDGRTWAECIAASMVRKAAHGGSVMAAAELADRTEGKPDQSVTLHIADMVKRAKDEHGIDITTDPLLSALFAAAGVDADSGEADRTTGPGEESNSD